VNINPLISICIPAYNAAQYIEEAINGWRNQTYPHLEIIVQDDCSKDETYNLAANISNEDFRVQVYKNNENLGIGGNWNEVFRKAKGEYLVMANADDIYEPEMIENALLIFSKNSDIDIISFKYYLYHESSNSINDIKAQENLTVGIQPDLFKLSFFHNPFHIVFTFFKKEKLDKITLKNGSLFLKTQVCDVELFFRAGKNKFKLYYSDYVAGKYRKHDTNNSDKPNGERYSWLFDVFPIYRQFLLENYRQETISLLKNRIIHLFKYHFKNLKPIDFKQLKAFLKEYFMFMKYS
jgi:glycosyltransferase involved in cell wall biosynthesis